MVKNEGKFIKLVSDLIDVIDKIFFYIYNFIYKY